MKFKVSKASEFFGVNEEIEISSLSDLQEIQNKHGHELVVNFHDGTIIVYDDCLE